MKLEIITGAFLGALILASLVTSSIMPLFLGVLLAGGGYYLYRGQQEREGPSSARPAKGASVSFDDIGGNLQAKRELKEALDFLCRSENAKELGIRPLKGVMLTGAPGTGKTMLAKAAAAYSDSLFYTAAGSQFIEMYAGVGAKRVRGLFSAARRDMKGSGKKSAVIFIDEIEVLGGKRGSHSSHLEYDQTLNQLLVEMDGMKSGEGHILVMGATNRLDLLDSALLRPGRFDRVVKVDLPDKESRGMILAIHTANKPLAGDVDLDELAGQTFGFSGAQLESLCNEAAIYALREDCREIGDRHFKSACEKVMI
ncbi:MAG: AAA family ATPase, partial [Clostridiales bacterium]|nr:AAA family ATPase [Clostridiales bacterium]